MYLQEELVPVRKDTHEGVEIVLHEEVGFLDEREKHLLEVFPLLTAAGCPSLRNTRPGACAQLVILRIVDIAS